MTKVRSIGMLALDVLKSVTQYAQGRVDDVMTSSSRRMAKRCGYCVAQALNADACECLNDQASILQLVFRMIGSHAAVISLSPGNQNSQNEQGTKDEEVESLQSLRTAHASERSHTRKHDESCSSSWVGLHQGAPDGLTNNHTIHLQKKKHMSMARIGEHDEMRTR